MPLISPHSLIPTHSLSMLTTSYLLVTSPSLITSSSPVWLLGESMHIRPSPSFSVPSEPLASLALVVALTAVLEMVFAGSLASVNAKSKEGRGVFAEQAAVLRNAQESWMV